MVGAFEGRVRGAARAGLAAALLLSLAACAANLDPAVTPTASIAGAPPSETARPKPRAVKVAMLLPLGGFGETSAIAKSMKQSAEMALFEHDNAPVQLIVKDDQGTAEGATRAATEALAEGAEIILGPLFASAVAGAAGPARTANVPIIAFSNDRKVAGNGVYLLSYLPEAEVERIVSFAASRGKRRFVGLVPAGDYGSRLEHAFRSAVARAGGTIVALETYGSGANAMLEPAQRVFEIIRQSEEMGAPVDALFLPGDPDTLPSLGPLIAYSAIDVARVQILGTGGWDYPNIGREDAFVGAWYPSPDPRGFQTFAQRFAATFGQAPPRMASLAYDAMSMTIALSGGGADRFAAGSIMAPRGFNGVDGPVRFGPNGLAEVALAVLEVKKFGSTVLDAAPVTAPLAPDGRLAMGAPGG